MRTTVARRAIAATALAIGLPLAVAGAAAAQSAPSGPSTPSGPSGPATSATTATTASVVTTARPVSTGGLARTGADAALPLAASAAAITVVLGGRRFASRLHG